MDAGCHLAAALIRFSGTEHLVILALPIGGVPVAAEITKALGMPFDVLMERLREQAGEVITFYEPEAFVAVGEWHDDFSQTGDDEVRELLAEAHPNEVPANQR